MANSRTPVPEHYGNGVRHHSAHQSLPQNNLGWFNPEVDKSGMSTSTATSGGYAATRHANSASETGFHGFGNNTQPMNSTTTTPSNSRPASMHMSYSMNDIPTTRRSNGIYGNVTPPRGNGEYANGMGYGFAPTPHSNQSVSSVTPPTPQSGDQDLRNGITAGGSYQSQIMSVSTQSDNNGTMAPTANSMPTHVYGFNNGAQYPANPAATYPSHVFGSYGSQALTPYSRGTGHSRRNTESEGNPFSRFTNVQLESYRGDLYDLCKDQHGCRYLQRKLEERVPENVEMIFNETNMHVVELMTGKLKLLSNPSCELLIDSFCRSLWQLSLPEAARVFQR